MTDDPAYPDSRDIGSTEGPPVDEKPFKILFEANQCIGTGRCAEKTDNWELDITTGVASPASFFVGEGELDANVAAAMACPAKKGRGVIHVIDRRSGEEIAPDPDGDGTISVDW